MAIEQKAALNAGATITGASVITDASQLFVAFPMLGFIAIGVVGGLSGFFLLQEQGRLDALSWRMNLCVLARRMMLGAAIGTVIYVGWADQSEARGLWLLATGIVATSPVEMIKKVVDLAQQVLTRKAG
ncbi:MAG: hypothetical protein VW362_01600 [Candidatus Nanopelagicales bacterium]